MGEKLDDKTCICEKCVNYEICKLVEETKEKLKLLRESLDMGNTMIDLTVTAHCLRFINSDFTIS